MLPAQHPLQMLLTMRSSLRFSASIFASLFGSRVTVDPREPGARVPLALTAPPEELEVPAAFVPGEGAFAVFPTPFRDPVLVDVRPDEFAVPTTFVPGDVADFAEFPAPLGSLPVLLRPPTFAGPLGTPLTAGVPAPAEPAFGVPTALLVPVVGPLEAPPVAAPAPAAPPPADDPPPPPALPPPPP